MERLVEERGCAKCQKDINWKKVLTKTLLKLFVSGIIKALITHIVLSHMKK